MKNKRCSKCKKIKNIEFFNKNKNTKDGYHHYCRQCYSIQRKTSYANNENIRNNAKIRTIKRRFNLDDKSLNELYSKHDSCCICSFKFESKRKTFIDHDHKTNKIRGILCPKCNTLLGLCDDSVQILQLAIQYLQRN